LPIVLPLSVIVLTPEEWPRWVFMWLLAFALYVGSKWLTWRRSPVEGASNWRQAGYLFGWMGLDAKAFLNPIPILQSQRPTSREWILAVAKTILGASLIWGVVRAIPDEYQLFTGWVGMIGIILLLHFGIFHLISCTWRAVGINARPIMNAPLASTSVSEFWSKRWNIAFRDMTHRFFFRPLSRLVRPEWGIGIGFLFSGLIHDAVISIPPNAGYGKPTLYFMIQGMALIIERTAIGRKMGLGRGWRGWIFTMFVLAAPVGLLFHPPFVRQVVLPFLLAIGAK